MNAEDRSLNDSILEMETCEIISNTNTICYCKVPILPITFTIVKNDTLTEMMRSITNEINASSYGFSICDGFFVHMEDPIIDTEGDVITEVIECTSLVLGFTKRRDVILRADDIL
jgi:hypothetical protein